MRRFTENYLENRREFYSTLLERIPDPDFTAAFGEAIGPLNDPSDTRRAVQELPEVADSDPELEALALDDLLKKSGIGGRLAKQVTSIREVLRQAEHLERVGLTWFQAIENKSLGDSASVIALAAARSNCLIRLLKLRDSLEFHHFKLVNP